MSINPFTRRKEKNNPKDKEEKKERPNVCENVAIRGIMELIESNPFALLNIFVNANDKEIFSQCNYKMRELEAGIYKQSRFLPPLKFNMNQFEYRVNSLNDRIINTLFSIFWFADYSDFDDRFTEYYKNNSLDDLENIMKRPINMMNDKLILFNHINMSTIQLLLMIKTGEPGYLVKGLSEKLKILSTSQFRAYYQLKEKDEIKLQDMLFNKLEHILLSYDKVIPYEGINSLYCSMPKMMQTRSKRVILNHYVNQFDNRRFRQHDELFDSFIDNLTAVNSIIPKNDNDVIKYNNKTIYHLLNYSTVSLENDHQALQKLKDIMVFDMDIAVKSAIMRKIKDVQTDERFSNDQLLEIKREAKKLAECHKVNMPETMMSLYRKLSKMLTIILIMSGIYYISILRGGQYELFHK